MLRNLLLLLSTVVGEVMAVDGRFLDLSTNVVVHVEAIIITTLITTARVYKRQIQQAIPAVCYQLCKNALFYAENDGEAAACLQNSPFSVAFLDCEDCISANVTRSQTIEPPGLVASLNLLLLYCNDSAAFTYFSSLLNVEATISVIDASLCSVNDITSDCPTTVATTSSKLAAVSTLVAASSAAADYSVASTSPLKSAGAIAGVAVACTLAVVFIIALIIFLCFRRRKRRKQDKIQKAETTNRQEEKAQLHSEDLKPIRKELSGDQPLTSKKDVSIAEMPANEDPPRTTSEMPANEAVGSEL